jgi:hypothetical protein
VGQLKLADSVFGFDSENVPFTFASSWLPEVAWITAMFEALTTTSEAPPLAAVKVNCADPPVPSVAADSTVNVKVAAPPTEARLAARAGAVQPVGSGRKFSAALDLNEPEKAPATPFERCRDRCAGGRGQRHVVPTRRRRCFCICGTAT